MNEQAWLRCGGKYPHVASTRLLELSAEDAGGLTFKTDAGRAVAAELARSRGGGMSARDITRSAAPVGGPRAPESDDRGLIVDLFAGPGGWSEGLRMVGLSSHEVGIEWDAAACAGAGHRIEQYEPLTISPSILCSDCGTHGFIREGRWVDA